MPRCGAAASSAATTPSSGPSDDRHGPVVGPDDAELGRVVRPDAHVGESRFSEPPPQVRLREVAHLERRTFATVEVEVFEDLFLAVDRAVAQHTFAALTHDP